MGVFKAGQITRIKVHGFMTYDDLEVIPKEGLNLIIGLNGSGKSSIMSAICLGLGGKPQYTGKSAQPSDFIKLGHDTAKVEIELAEPNGRKVVIGRTIERMNKSTYFLNGSMVNQTEVMAVAKKYNIDVGNLCQFLPQEKVAEFSKMDKKKRLDNMLQAIGEPQLFRTFEELKMLRINSNELEKDLKQLTTNKESEIKVNTRLKAEVEKQEERKRLQMELNNLKVRKTVLKYEGAREELKALKEEKKQLEAQKLKMQREKNAMEAEISSSGTERDNCMRKMRAKQTRIETLSDKLQKNQNLLADLERRVHHAKVDFQTMITEKMNQQTRLAELLKQITGLTEQLKGLKKENGSINSQLENNLSQHQAVKRELSKLDPKIEEANLEMNQYEYSQKSFQQRISVLKNEEDKKMNFLRQRSRHTYDAVVWLKKNTGQFKSTIFLPALLTIKVENENCSKYIENNVNIRDLLTFVCQEKDDVKRLTDILRGQMNLPVNIALVPQAGTSKYQSPQITEAMRRMWIQCFLKDLFTAPDPIMNYLCQIYFMHHIPICNSNANNNVESILGMFRTFFTDTERVSGLKSKYGNKNLSVKRDHITGKQMLINSKDQTEELRQLETQLRDAMGKYDKLREQFDELKNFRTSLERKQEQQRAEKFELLEKQKKIRNIEIQLGQKKETYARKESEVIDEREEKEKEKAKIGALNTEMMKILASQCSDLKEFRVLKEARVQQIPFIKILSRRVTQLTESITEKKAESQEIEKRLLEITRECDRVKKLAVALCEEIKNTDQETLQAQCPELLQENQWAMFAATLDIDDVEQKISNIQAQLELNCDVNEEAIQDYERRKRIILETQSNIENQQKRLEALLEDIQQKKTGWLLKLEKHISNINAKFTQYYKFLECAGEVSLDKSQDSNNFLDYGLQIRLKYRVDEEFMELSQTHHSGGECSVAAIIFILSLQELTNVPFRCIDEINQGMDSINERKIYELIADASKTGSSCSQYFLLTPKLLMDLSYHDGVAVHIIYNSRFLRTNMNLKKHLEIVKNQRAVKN